jgi:hypothetical protein
MAVYCDPAELEQAKAVSLNQIRAPNRSFAAVDCRR